ncbi:MAG: AHH domain-containing protein [Bacteroidetes bacterium]|nr:AHH domain-containing protein [Bacteroidota bacterium]MCB0846132.1 AHH domain-containing protein [Bacteroidota bacterium]
MTKAKQAPAKAKEMKCVYCGKKHKFPAPGNGSGNGVTLGNNLSISRDSHPWQLKGNLQLTGWLKRKYAKQNSIQAHHLIASSVIRNGKSSKKTWKTICTRFGYDINKKENGVWLPSIMAIACQLGIPLHRGGHPPSYYRLVRADVKLVMDKAAKGGYCPSNYKNMIKKLDSISSDMLDQIKSFSALLTVDAKDYKKGPNSIGCAGVQSISGKPNKKCDRNHGLPVSRRIISIGK